MVVTLIIAIEKASDEPFNKKLPLMRLVVSMKIRLFWISLLWFHSVPQSEYRLQIFIVNRNSTGFLGCFAHSESKSFSCLFFNFFGEKSWNILISTKCPLKLPGMTKDFVENFYPQVYSRFIVRLYAELFIVPENIISHVVSFSL